jgi:hypothetical protein
MSLSGSAVSVLYQHGAEETWWVDATRPWMCEGCGEAIQVPCVYWHGRRTLFWHPECATTIGAHLIADAREATLAVDPRPHWRKRVVSAVRHRLMAEELVA